MQTPDFRLLGVLLAEAVQEPDSQSLGTKQASAEYRHQDSAWSTAVCGLARDIFDLTEGEGSTPSFFVRGVVKSAALGDPNGLWLRQVLTEATEEALGAEVCMEKQAIKGVGGLSLAGIRAGTALSPALLKTLLFASAATGAGAGTIAWGLNRDAREDDEELERMQTQIDTYNRISREIGNKLRDRGVDLEGVRDISGAQQVVERGNQWH